MSTPQSLVPDEHKMTREQAGPWLVALRQGGHQQAAGCLCTFENGVANPKASYCCLGIRALVEDATFKQDHGEVAVFVPGRVDRINDAEMLVSAWAEPRGLTYDVQTLLARLNDGNTAWLRADHELVKVYKAIAARSTANESHTVDHLLAGFTCEFEKHDFGMIADVIEKYFIK